MTKRVKVYKKADLLAEYLERFRRREFDGSFWALQRFALLVKEFKDLVFDEAAKVGTAEANKSKAWTLEAERAKHQKKAGQKKQVTSNKATRP
jgi:hypothetical protein